MSYTTSLDPIRPGTPEDAHSEHTASPSRRTFLGGIVTATTLGLMLSLAVPAAFSQPQTPPDTDAFGVERRRPVRRTPSVGSLKRADRR